MIATLPMYDRPETAAANDALWRAIRTRLGFGPDHLTRPDDPWPLWQSPDLLLGQTCGLPYRARLHDRVQLVGTPDYGLEGCPPGYYCSVFIARSANTTLQDLSGQRFAYNESLSQSGWAAPCLHMTGLGLEFGPLLATGAHRASALAVAGGSADFAALDALTWELIRDHDDFAAGLHPVAVTTPTPGLPLITAPGNDAGALHDAVSHAIASLPLPTRTCLHLRGLVRIPAADYLTMPTPASPQS